MAEYVLKDMVAKAGLSDSISVDSAGISNEEVGNSIHSGTVGVLRRHNIDHDALRPARQVTADDMQHFDYLLAMDHGHLGYLQRHAGSSPANMDLFLRDARTAGMVAHDQVPDPWYDGQYDRTYDLVTKGCAAFLKRLRAEHSL